MWLAKNCDHTEERVVVTHSARAEEDDDKLEACRAVSGLMVQCRVGASNQPVWIAREESRGLCEV